MDANAAGTYLSGTQPDPRKDNRERTMPHVLPPPWPGHLSALFAVTALWASTPSGGQGRDSNQGRPDRFVGAWRLASLDEPDADGIVHRVERTGMLVFTREGRMSV
jgi:hypothetical protein